MFTKQLVIDRSIIRIKSARKWPEKVVLKTSQPKPWHSGPSRSLRRHSPLG